MSNCTGSSTCRPSRTSGLSPKSRPSPISRPGLAAWALCLVVALGANLAMGPQALAQSAPDDLARWNAIKDSQNPADLDDYRASFPSGAFAPLAKLRADKLRSDSGSSTPRVATAPPTATTQPSGVNALTSVAVIKEVQTILYNFNYNPSRVGRLDDKTRTAITEWQGNNSLPVTGVVDANQLQTLRGLTPPKTWGALAFGARGAFGTVWGKPTRKAAEDEARSVCRRGAAGDTCSLVSAANTGCGVSTHAAGVVRGTRHNQAFANVRATLDLARAAALEQCKAGARVPSACVVRATFCANGSHQ